MANAKRDAQLEQRWRQLVDQWRRSKQTVRAFCHTHQLSEASFYAWRRTLAQRAHGSPVTTPPAFVPVQVVVAAPLEVVLPSGVVIRVPTGADTQVVVQLVAALGAQR
jgi:transposase-like protein